MTMRKITCVLSVVCSLLGLSGPAQSGIIDPDFLGEQIAADSTVLGIVWLRDQPQYELSRQVRARFDARLEELAREVQAAGGGETPLGEEILKQIDELTTKRAAQMAWAVRASIGPGQEATQAQIEQIGGKVNARLTVINGLIARFPFGKLGQIADLPMVSYIEKPSGEGGEGMLDISTGSIKANTFWDASPSITGAGMDLGIVDRGVNGDISSLQKSGRHFFYSPDSTDYTEIGYQSSSTGDHGTSVTAIVAATGDTLGVAYGLDDVISAARWEGAFGEFSVYGAYDWIVSIVPPDSGETAEVINCSAGSQAVSGESYPEEAKFIDSVVDHWGVPVVVPAGNLGGPEKRLVHGAHSYNAIVVGNIDDNDDTTRSNDSIYLTSSRGPTYDDRRKPDLVAPGTNIYSLNADGDWGPWTGTSHAAPHIAGAVLLLRQKTGLSNTMALKAVLINSADDSTGAGDPAGWEQGLWMGLCQSPKGLSRQQMVLRAFDQPGSDPKV